MQGADDQRSKSTVSHAEGHRGYEEFPQSTKQLDQVDQARPQRPFGRANLLSGCKQVRKDILVVSVFVYRCVNREHCPTYIGDWILQWHHFRKCIYRYSFCEKIMG